ncbi:MAG: TIGR01906 family membrane protein [Oscillospiraceae bacterium]|nr:TIGR01906 family membrane protein [Oscillospiraceae bacterium]
MIRSRNLTVLMAVILALLLLSLSIAAPILIRPFYYAHIEAFDLPLQTGLTVEEIKTAYNEMMDYCLGKTDIFSTGVLLWSEEGKSHFDDVAVLFKLDLSILAVTAACTLAAALLLTKRKISFATICGRGPLFWAAMVIGVPFVVIGGLAAADFDRAFVVFHSVFFPGKTNWIFDWNLDQIIRILPQDFFMNCGIFILTLLLTGCAAFAIADILIFKKEKVTLR